MLFWIVLIIFIIYYVNKKNKTNGGKTIPNQPRPNTVETYANPAQPQVKRTLTSEERQRLDAYRAAKNVNPSGYTAPSASGYPVNAQKANAQQKQDILVKAQKNAKKYEKDTTLEQLEEEHNHSEKVKATITKEALQEKKDMHPHDASHVAEVVAAEGDSILGNLEDLMIKGYDGNLSFERDFVGEAMDMISHFSVPDTVPDVSK